MGWIPPPPPMPPARLGEDGHLYFGSERADVFRARREKARRIEAVRAQYRWERAREGVAGLGLLLCWLGWEAGTWAWVASKLAYLLA